MGIAYSSVIFDRGERLGLLAVILLTFVALGASRTGAATPIAAQLRTKINPKDGLTYVWIAPGKFRMGCSQADSKCLGNEKPAHMVTLTKGFWIGQTEVTQAAYKKVIGSNPSHFKGDQLPVDKASWNEARAYCAGTNMRLPTEAEWEYAARGGSPAARYAPLVQIAWYEDNSKGTHAVGKKQANGYGPYDMLGNVWEWVADWYEPYGTASAVDPKGPQMGQFRVLRGGSWVSESDDVRVSSRGKNEPDDRYYNDGFRCAGD